MRSQLLMIPSIRTRFTNERVHDSPRGSDSSEGFDFIWRLPNALKVEQSFGDESSVFHSSVTALGLSTGAEKARPDRSSVWSKPGKVKGGSLVSKGHSTQNYTWGKRCFYRQKRILSQVFRDI